MRTLLRGRILHTRTKDKTNLNQGENRDHNPLQNRDHNQGRIILLCSRIKKLASLKMTKPGVRFPRLKLMRRPNRALSRLWEDQCRPREDQLLRLEDQKSVKLAQLSKQKTKKIRKMSMNTMQSLKR